MRRACWILAAVSIPVLSLSAADWPRWRGPAGDGRVPEGVAVPQSLPAELKDVWRIPVGEGFGSPVVADGRVYLLDDQLGRETVSAFDAATGKGLWKRSFDDVHKDNQLAPGPRGTPLVDGDRVYVQSCRGQFECLGAADGRPRWAVNFVKDFGAVYIGEKGQATGASRHGNSCSPVVDGERLFASAGGTNGASVVCFDKTSGRVLWKSQNDIPGYTGPVIATIAGVKQAIAFTSEALIGLDPQEGVLLWRVPVKTQFGRHITTHVVAGDLVLVSSHTAGLMAVRVARAGAGWTVAPAWVSQEAAINMSSFVAAGDHLYGLGSNRKLECVDVKTGARVWAQGDVLGGPLVKDYVGFLGMGRNLLLLTYDGQLLLVAADPKECRVLGRTQLCGKTWCLPAYADGRLYFRDAKELRCVVLGP